MVDKDNNSILTDYVTFVGYNPEIEDIVRRLWNTADGQKIIKESYYSEGEGKLQIAASDNIVSSYRLKEEDKSIFSEIGREFVVKKVFGNFDSNGKLAIINAKQTNSYLMITKDPNTGKYGIDNFSLDRMVLHEIIHAGRAQKDIEKMAERLVTDNITIDDPQKFKDLKKIEYKMIARQKLNEDEMKLVEEYEGQLLIIPGMQDKYVEEPVIEETNKFMAKYYGENPRFGHSGVLKCSDDVTDNCSNVSKLKLSNKPVYSEEDLLINGEQEDMAKAKSQVCAAKRSKEITENAINPASEHLPVLNGVQKEAGRSL